MQTVLLEPTLENFSSVLLNICCNITYCKAYNIS